MDSKKKSFYDINLSETINSGINNAKDIKLDLDDNVKKIKDKVERIGEKEINFDFITRITRSIYINPNKLAKLEMLQYIMFIIIIYYYNPLNITTEHPSFTKLLVLTVSFAYVMLFFFIRLKIDAGEDIDFIEPTEKGTIIKYISVIVFFILFMLIIQSTLWLLINTKLSKLLEHSMSIIIVTVSLSIVYLFMKKTIDTFKNEKGHRFSSLLLKIIMYIPCLIVDIIEKIKYEFNLTSKPVWILIGMEIVFILIWLILPYIFDKITNYNGLKLINQPINLNKEYTIGNYQDLHKLEKTDPYDLSNIIDSYNKKKKNRKEKEENNILNYNLNYNKNKECDIDDIKGWMYKIKSGLHDILNKIFNLNINFDINQQFKETDYRRYKYKYSLSGWFYLNPQPPNTSYSYSKYTNIIKYGNKVRLEYNGKKNYLRVMAEKASLNEDDNSKNEDIEVFKTKNVFHQKWNNVVINYDNGYIDVFLNGILVGSSVGIVPYMHEDKIIVGANQGLYGGICNVLYYEEPLSKNQILMNYRTLRIQEIPYIYSLSDDVSLNFERKENNKNLLLNDLKSMVGA